MVFLPLISVLCMDKNLLRLGKASHDDLPAQILPLGPRASRQYQHSTVHDSSQTSNGLA